MFLFYIFADFGATAWINIKKASAKIKIVKNLIKLVDTINNKETYIGK
jgi:hypothetical protein